MSNMILAAGTLGTIVATVATFLIITLLLVVLLLVVKQKLSPSGPVKITINGEKEIEVASGSSLLSTLGGQKIFLPSACGGGGTCIQCECHVLSGGGEALPTETPHFSRSELQHGARLACQVKVKQDMDITIPEEVFDLVNLTTLHLSHNQIEVVSSNIKYLKNIETLKQNDNKII